MNYELNKESEGGGIPLAPALYDGAEAVILKDADILGSKFQIYGTKENPLFKAKDVAALIQHSDVSTMLKNIECEEKVLLPCDTKNVCITSKSKTRKTQNFWMLTEDGLYEVLMQSRKPIAKQFKKAVKEVLRQIRQTGGYIATGGQDTEADIMARALMIAQKTIERKSGQIEALESEKRILTSEKEILTGEVEKLTPRAAYTDMVLQAGGTYTFTQMAKELGFGGAPTLIQKLRKMDVIYWQSGQWMLKSRYCGHGYTANRTACFKYSDGTLGSNVTTVWTEVGRAWLHIIFNRGRK
ncbi:MAG: phage antirepressor KilAC domain-containing protein [Bacteroidales bacterium]|nr:phage antirepressor KilAC domain-containing protein [Candidatus Egerieousia equi]